MTIWRGALLCWLGVTAARSQTPVFRGSADIVVADVQITTRSGDVIGDLTAADFTLKVDGKPRPILNVVHERIDDARPAKRRGAGAMSTLAMGPSIEAQSFVMILADPSSIRAESSRLLFDQVADFVATLPAAHSVGLILLPARQPQYPFSVERQPIVNALRKQLGTLHSGMSSMPGETYGAIDGIDAAVRALEDVDGRRTMVLLTDSLSDPDGRLLPIAKKAVDANITIHAISSDPPEVLDMSKRKPIDMPVKSSDGAGILSDLTGGWYFRRATNGSIVMPRVAQMLAEQYVLTFSTESADKDGRPHRIEVNVNRRGAEVRARSSFVR